jgi:hypothetical protein
MLRRLSISFWLLLAFAILQAHNFIPHHHESEHVKTGQHHDDHAENDRHHEDHEDEADHDSPISDLTHNSEFGKTIVKPQDLKDIIEKPVLLIAGHIILLYNEQAAPDNPALYHPPDGDSPLHIIFLSHSLPFRAPPAFFS